MDYNLNNSSSNSKGFNGQSTSSNLSEHQIRSIVKDEIYKNAHSGTPVVPKHNHDKVNSPRILNSNISRCIPTAAGSTTFSHTGDYVFNLYPNSNVVPTTILCNAVVVDNTGIMKYMSVGSAQIGQSFYFQPSTTSSLVVGGPQQPFVQTSTYFGYDGSNFRSLTGGGNIVDIQYPVGTTHARLRVTACNSTSVTFSVLTLDTGWNIYAAITVI